MPLVTIESFEVLSDHGDEGDDDGTTNETTEMMPQLPPDSWLKKTRFAGSFGNLAMKITKTKRIHSLIVGMGAFLDTKSSVDNVTCHRKCDMRNKYRMKKRTQQATKSCICFRSLT